MDHQAVAKWALAGVCVVQGLATPLLDLNRTHATNPEWPRHARFHVVWQTFGVVLLSAVEMALIFGGWFGGDGGFYLAALLASLSPVAFLVTVMVRRMFGGKLSDANGIQPALLRLGGRVVRVDMNLVAAVVALVSVGVMVVIYRG